MPRLWPNMARLSPQRDVIDLEPPRWILASASPRRRELLVEAGQCFDVIPSGAPEEAHPGESGEALSRRLAFEKAAEVAERHPGRWVLGADTLVLCDDVILGKPADRAAARHMLERLSGRPHRVVTAFVLIDPRGGVAERLAIESVVVFRDLSATEIESYLALQEWSDKAGGYAIQGAARAFVHELRGSYTNVVGLPLEAVEQALRAQGLWREHPA